MIGNFELIPSRYDYVKLMNIVAHSLFLEKQHNKLRENCFNSVFLENKRDAGNFCSAHLTSKIDFTLWNDQSQETACLESLTEIAHLTGLSKECIEDANA